MYTSIIIIIDSFTIGRVIKIVMCLSVCSALLNSIIPVYHGCTLNHTFFFGISEVVSQYTVLEFKYRPILCKFVDQFRCQMYVTSSDCTTVLLSAYSMALLLAFPHLQSCLHRNLRNQVFSWPLILSKPFP